MFDWNEYRKELGPRIGVIGKLFPDPLKGYLALNGAGRKTNPLDGKTRELIALG